MDRQKDTARGLGSVVTRVVPASGLLALMVLLAVLWGCQNQGNSMRQLSHRIRPATQTSRLVQNAEYLRKSGRLELAVEELEEALLQEPDNLAILDLLARCYEELGYFDRAQELYDKALSVAGHHAALENNRCYSLYLQGRLDQAESCFRKVLAREPANQTARNNLGLVLCRQGREAEALALWREALSAPQAWQLLEQALTALDREMPPHLAALAPSPADRRTAAAGAPAASPAEPSGLRASRPAGQDMPAPAQARPAPLPSPAAASWDRDLTPAGLAGQSPGEPQNLAGSAPAPAAASPPENAAARTAPGPSESPSASTTAATEQSPAPGAQTNPEPPAPQAAVAAAPVQVTASSAAEEKPAAPAAAKPPVKESLQASSLSPPAPEAQVTPPGHPLRQFLARLVRLLTEGDSPARAASAGGTPQASTPVPRPEVKAAPAPAVSPAAVAVAASSRQEEPAATASPPGSEDTSIPFLTSRELLETRIELKNGNGAQNLARDARRLLSLEGFTVVAIGNHIDFGLEETTIAYRPEAARVARVLAQKFFPQARLKADGKTSRGADIRVSLGRDLAAAPDHLAHMIP